MTFFLMSDWKPSMMASVTISAATPSATPATPMKVVIMAKRPFLFASRDRRAMKNSVDICSMVEAPPVPERKTGVGHTVAAPAALRLER